MNEKTNTVNTIYYPRKMRTGWCVAHEVTAAGTTIERYGIRCQTYTEAYRRAEVMNRKQQPEAGNTRSQDRETTAMKPPVSEEKGGGRL